MLQCEDTRSSSAITLVPFLLLRCNIVDTTTAAGQALSFSCWATMPVPAGGSETAIDAVGVSSDALPPRNRG